MTGVKRDFTIQQGNRWRRVVVGVDGQQHDVPVYKRDGAYVRGKDNHFTDEGEFRRAIERAMEENTR